MIFITKIIFERFRPFLTHKIGCESQIFALFDNPFRNLTTQFAIMQAKKEQGQKVYLNQKPTFFMRNKRLWERPLTTLNESRMNRMYCVLQSIFFYLIITKNQIWSVPPIQPCPAWRNIWGQRGFIPNQFLMTHYPEDQITLTIYSQISNKRLLIPTYDFQKQITS